jgi:hypothetical protein
MALILADNHRELMDNGQQKIAALKSHMIDVFMEGDVDAFWTLSGKMRRLLARRHRGQPKFTRGGPE